MEDRPMTIVEHLEELRRRLLLAFAALGAGTAVGFIFVDRVLDYLIHMIGVERVVFFAPAEAVFTRIKVALFIGVFIGLPVILYQLWAFVAVGLTQTERRAVTLLLPPSMVLFVLGAAFGLFVIMPIGLRVLLSYQTETLQPMLAIGPTLSFVIAFILAFGFVFQIPMVVLFLARVGLVTPASLAATRRYAIVAIVVLAAVLTPGTDVVSQLLMAVPTYALYEASIWIARLVAPKPHAGAEPALE
ncbi:MAG: twin-arginine translocase subunit TatC [Armatimonadota bacterium]|nr:twin-arginine translocase subunit TatC [Armatimonadota bacterium]MDR7422264.1 twin-arginine translocase subunit TatC [Armatimonadota bacterium]MDR7456313.1 twin-arginine translocase subunit TatC [Armatimonadota bacterium]MDR7496310.1 twin-arginine translocase subunit TatC [Armatimonadota bacterium]MDR7512460.1 twin-arginine translocase subunit TatC [Armatimonadota bacterium]